MIKYVLQNGLKVYLNRIEDKRIIDCGIWVRQGSKDENCNTNGLSHFVEHMMFRNKCRESEFDMKTSIDKLRKGGAFYNAATTKDNTYFYIQGLKDDYKIFLETLSYIVTNKEKTLKEGLEKEKEIVLREAENHFMSTRQMPDRIGQALWGNKFYGNPVIGTVENIRKFTSDMVDDLIKKVYTPDNSCLVINGDFNIEEMKKGIDKYFSKWKGICNKESIYISKIRPCLLVDDRFKGNRTTVGIGLSGYSKKDFKYLYLEILKDNLINADSRLLSRLRDEMGLLYSIDGYTNAFSDSGNMGLVFSANNDSVEMIIETIIEECKVLAEKGIDNETFELLKRKKLVKTIFAFENSAQTFESLGKAALYGKIFSLERYIKQIESLKKDKMDEVIHEILKYENLAMAVLGCADMKGISKKISISYKNANELTEEK